MSYVVGVLIGLAGILLRLFRVIELDEATFIMSIACFNVVVDIGSQRVRK